MRRQHIYYSLCDLGEERKRRASKRCQIDRGRQNIFSLNIQVDAITRRA